MKKDLKYIIRRIIIGVGIALTLGFLRGNLIANVHALQVDSYAIGQYSTVIDNLTTSFTHNISGNPWASLSGTYGYINGSIGIYKVSGGSTDPNVMPLMVYVNSGNYNFPCTINSVSMENSTYNGGSYSYRCPIRMTQSGITSISVQFESLQFNANSQYRLAFGSLISYEIHEEGDVNVDVDVDTNGVISESQVQGNANRQQMQNSTNSIINNQNSNTDREIESQKVCSFIDKNNIVSNNNILGSTGYLYEQSYSGFGVTDYISVSSNDTLEMLQNLPLNSPSAYFCFYNINKIPISGSCLGGISSSNIGIISIPSGASYFRGTINVSQNKPTFKLCRNGNQAISDSVNDLNNTINNDSVDTGQANGFFSNFTTNSHGLSGIITAPLRMITSLSTSTCSSLSIPLPFVNQNATIPCMSSIYSLYPTFLTLWQLITTGLVAYYICINIFASVRKMQRPDDDRIEVLNL